MKKSSIKDVAEDAGVSPATVSRVLNDTDYPVKQQTKETVKKAAKELNYQPNQIARSLAKEKSNIISIVVHDLSSAYFSAMLRGIEDVIYENDFMINVFDTRYSLKRQIKALNILRANQVSGLIFPGGIILKDEYMNDIQNKVEDMKENNCIIIGVTNNSLDIKNIDIGNELAAQTITDYLINNGHNHIACIQGPESLNASKERFNGYQNALGNRGFDLNEKIIVKGGFSFRDGREAAAKLNKYINDFTAVVAANDESALGFVWEMQNRGNKIPEDISVVSIGNNPILKHSNPPLTSVNLPLYEIGKNIGNYMHNTLKNQKKITEDYEISVGIVVRESVKKIN